MSARAMIAISIGNGANLAAHVTYEGDETLHAILTEHYATRELAANLLTLGSLLIVGKTIGDCVLMVPGVHKEPVLCLNGDDLEDERMGNEHHVHLFTNGAWHHWMSEEAIYERSVARDD